MTITINCDMGESFGLYTMGDDEGLMPFIDLANVACGFHASDPDHMRATVRLAKKHGVRVGAHPSYPDLQGFGRRYMKMRREELANHMIYQVGALVGFLKAEGMELSHIKPHGALAGAATREEEVAHAVCDVADIYRVPLMALPGDFSRTIYAERGHTVWNEFYADLAYDDDGHIIITREHHAVDPVDTARRIRRAIREGKTESVSGKDVPAMIESVCVHSDTPNAVDVARAVREALKEPEAA